MGRYKVNHRYAAYTTAFGDGEQIGLEEGAEVELDEERAEWINRDSPGTLTAAKATVDIPDGEPAEDWRLDQLRAYAEREQVDVAGLKSKADVLARIAEAKQPAPPVEPPARSDQTPPDAPPGNA